MDDIAKHEMDSKLSARKGWICNSVGNEYIYDFHLKSFPIIVKVSSSVRIDRDRSANKNSNIIRVHAVKKQSLDKKAKIVCGLVKARKVFVEDGWENKLEEQVLSVIDSAKTVFNKKSRFSSRR